MPKDAFGLPDPEATSDPELEFLNLGLEAEGQSQAPEAATEPSVPEPQEGVQEAPGGPEKVEPTQGMAEPTEPISEAAKKYANKFETPEDLERGYNNLFDMHMRSSNRAAEAEARAQETAEKMAQMEAGFQNWARQMQQQAWQQQQVQQPQEPVYDQYGNQVKTPARPVYTPEMVQQMLDNAVAQRMQGYQEQVGASMQKQQEVQLAERAVDNFFQRHPDVSRGSTEDNEIFETIMSLNDSWRNQGWELDITDDHAFDVAYEASKRPALRQVLAMNSQYIESDAGMGIARFQASLLEGKPINQIQTNVPASQLAPTQVVPQRKPVVERASTGATPGGTPEKLDEFEEGVLEHRKAKKGGLGPIFG